MQVIIKTIDDNLEEKELSPISFSDWLHYKTINEDITLYKKIPVLSYRLVTESFEIPRQKEVIVRESIKDFIIRRKQVRCAVSNCNKPGLYVGNFCNKHFEKAWRVMKKRGITMQQLKVLIEKRRNEK